MGKTQAGVVASVAIVLASIMVSEPSVPASAATATTTSVADAFVLKSSPTSNRGTATTIRVRNREGLVRAVRRFGAGG